MYHHTDRIAHTTAFVTPVVEHWLERDISLEGIFKLKQSRISHTVNLRLSIAKQNIDLCFRYEDRKVDHRLRQTAIKLHKLQNRQQRRKLSRDSAIDTPSAETSDIGSSLDSNLG